MIDFVMGIGVGSTRRLISAASRHAPLERSTSSKGLVERLGLKEGARVLDVGCRTGRLAQGIAERVGIMGAVTDPAPRVSNGRHIIVNGLNRPV
jgi:hypothetical protein